MLTSLAAALLAASAQAAPLELTVKGLSKTSGAVLVSLFGSEKAWKSESPDKEVKLPAVLGETRAVVDLPPGEYMFFLYHDVNGNGKLETTFLGFPNEPYAFSNDFKLGYSKPPWSKTKFKVPADGAAHAVTLVHP